MACILTIDITPAPLAVLAFDLLPLATVSMDRSPVAFVVFNQNVFAQVEVPLFPAELTEDFLSSNGEFLASDGEALSW